MEFHNRAGGRPMAMEFHSCAKNSYGNPQPRTPVISCRRQAEVHSTPSYSPKSRTFVLLLLLTSLACGTQHRENGLIFSDWRIMKPLSGGTLTVGYGRIRNTGTPKTLIAVTLDCAPSVSLHETYENNGRLTMRSVPKIPLPPGAWVEFTPGGTHLMIERLTIPASGHCQADFLVYESAEGKERTYSFAIPLVERQ